MTQPSLHLLDLPIEIISHILLPFLTTHHNAPIPLCPPSCSPSPFADPSSILPILLTHPRLHAIATPLLYSPEHVFLLDLTGSNHARIRREFAQPQDGLLASRGALRRVGALRVKLDRLRGWMGERVVPMVADMIMRGQLSRLEIHLTGRHLAHDAEKLGMELLTGFVGLLADPDLRSARMYVPRRHAREWCRFHGGGVRCRNEEGKGGGGYEDGEDDGMVEVDWRGMVGEADPRREHVPVAAA